VPRATVSIAQERTFQPQIEGASNRFRAEQFHRLSAVAAEIAGGVESVHSPQRALEVVEEALTLSQSIAGDSIQELQLGKAKVGMARISLNL
jgi:hypothetical protein